MIAAISRLVSLSESLSEPDDECLRVRDFLWRGAARFPLYAKYATAITRRKMTERATDACDATNATGLLAGLLAGLLPV